jgi:hypothetical protein
MLKLHISSLESTMPCIIDGHDEACMTYVECVQSCIVRQCCGVILMLMGFALEFVIGKLALVLCRYAELCMPRAEQWNRVGHAVGSPFLCGAVIRTTANLAGCSIARPECAGRVMLCT